MFRSLSIFSVNWLLNCWETVFWWKLCANWMPIAVLLATFSKASGWCVWKKKENEFLWIRDCQDYLRILKSYHKKREKYQWMTQQILLPSFQIFETNINFFCLLCQLRGDFNEKSILIWILWFFICWNLINVVGESRNSANYSNLFFIFLNWFRDIINFIVIFKLMTCLHLWSEKHLLFLHLYSLHTRDMKLKMSFYGKLSMIRDNLHNDLESLFMVKSTSESYYER
jgi:hypothetical protein